jgi:flagellar motor component MotA
MTARSADRPLGLIDIVLRVAIVGLIGYAAATIIGWAIQGPYFTTAYIAKAIEVTLIVVLAVDFARMDGNPVNVIKSEFAQLSARFGRRSATGSAGA